MRIYEDADKELKVLVDNEILETDSFIKNCRIKYLFKIKMNDDKILGQCRKATGIWKTMTNYDFIISINKDFWNKSNDIQKKALLYHEILHIGWKEPTDKKEGYWLLKKHDTSLFIDVIHRFGCWTEDIGILRNVMKDSNLTFDNEYNDK